MDMLYFAWVRERVGTGHERLDPPAEVKTVADLIVWLAGLSPGHAEAFRAPERLRCAVDQRFVPLDAPVAGAREVALFPPVTGG